MLASCVSLGRFDNNSLKALGQQVLAIYKVTIADQAILKQSGLYGTPQRPANCDPILRFLRIFAGMDSLQTLYETIRRIHK